MQMNKIAMIDMATVNMMWALHFKEELEKEYKKNYPKGTLPSIEILHQNQVKEGKTGGILLCPAMVPGREMVEFLEHVKIKNWLIVFQADREDEEFEIRFEWEQAVKNIRGIWHFIDRKDIKGATDWANSLQENLFQSALVISGVHGAGKDTLMQICKNSGMDWEFREAYTEREETWRPWLDKVPLIVGISDSVDGFYLPVPKDGPARCIFILNKADQNPQMLLFSREIENCVKARLIASGWPDDGVLDYRILTASLKYTEYLMQMETGKLKKWRLIKDPDFILWDDELCLPLNKEEHADKAEVLLEKMDIRQKLKEYMAI